MIEAARVQVAIGEVNTGDTVLMPEELLEHSSSGNVPDDDRPIVTTAE